jgi:hypothetical protein
MGKKKLVESGLAAIGKMLGAGDDVPGKAKAAAPVIPKSVSKEEQLAAIEAARAKAATQKTIPAYKAFEPFLGGKAALLEADRTKVGDGRAGGPLFSMIHPGFPWGVGKQAKGTTIMDTAAQPNTVATTYLGGATQIKSNPVVFDQMYDEFIRSLAEGLVSQKSLDEINQKLSKMLEAPIDVADPLSKELIAKSFDTRAAAGDLFLGEGSGGPRQPFALRSKQVVVENTEPMLLHPEHGGTADTFSVGPRAFTLSGEQSFRPDLNAGYPYILHGQDQGVMFNPVPLKVFNPTTWEQSVKNTGKPPGSWTLSRKVRTEDITDKWLRHLEDAEKRGYEGYAEGGEVDPIKQRAADRVAVHNEAVQKFGVGGLLKKAAKAVAEKPVDRLSMGFKDVTKRTPELQEAAQALDRGELTAAKYAKLVKKHKPVTRYASVPMPATEEQALGALTKPKQAMYGKTAEIPAGSKTDLRLDIPSYANHGVWINSVHQADQPTVYGPTSAAKNVTMKVPAHKALETAKGGPKAPYATMSGEWNPMTAEEAYARAKEFIDHPEWRQIGFDPERHGYFYDRETMEPITHADEVIQVGPLVLARGAKHVPPEGGHKYADGGIVLQDADSLSQLFHASPEGGQAYASGGKVGMIKKALKEISGAKATQEEKVAEYVDPATEKIEDWSWRDLPSVAKEIGLTEVPDYIQKGYGDFMKSQMGRALAGDMSLRDFIKAYTITRSSVNRGGLPYTSATKTGMKLPQTGELVRPEGAYAEWLGSKSGQKYLDSAEKGKIDLNSIYDAVSKFEPFGMSPKLGEDMIWAAQHGKTAIPNLNSLVTNPLDEYRSTIQSVPGIGPAKSGFVASLLGRGDLPTFDARQIRLHTGQGGKEASKFMRRGEGRGGDEAVDRLAARQQAMDMGIDPDLLPFYQHLVHHGVWDKTAGSETTHDDLIRAMRGYAGGGKVGMVKKAAKELGSLGKKAIQSVKDLADDVLPASEREANLAKMLSDSQIKERLYHATPKDFDVFKVGGPDPSISGHAIWLSNQPSHQPAAHHIGSNANPKPGTNVMPVYVQAKRPMVLDDENMLKWAQSAYANKSPEFPYLMPKDWADRVKEDYDSIILADPYGHGDAHEVIMFNPNQIKSAIGNRGTYDTTKPEVNKAKGGVAKVKRSK